MPLEEHAVNLSSMDMHLPFEAFDIEDIDAALSRLNVDRSVKPVEYFVGGTSRTRTLSGHSRQRRLKSLGNPPR